MRSVNEPLLFQMIQKLHCRHGGVLESRPHGLECQQGIRLVDADLIHDEVVGMPNLDVVGSERRFRKMPQVQRYDHIDSADNCRGNDMPVVRVGQFDAVDQVLIARDQAILDALIHFFESVRDLVLPLRVARKRARVHSSLMWADQRRKEIRSREAEERIPHGLRVQHTGIEEYRKGIHRQSSSPDSWVILASSSKRCPARHSTVPCIQAGREEKRADGYPPCGAGDAPIQAA